MEDAKAARAAQEEKQAKDLAEKLAARRTKFAGQFEHVWIDGDTQISMVQVTLSDGSQIDNLIDALMWDNIFADCDVVQQGMSRMFLRGGKEVIEIVRSNSFSPLPMTDSTSSRPLSLRSS